jgi:hypothetical protein
MERSRQPRPRAAMRGAVVAGIAVAGVATFAATPAKAQVRILAQVTTSRFVHTATHKNTDESWTTISSPATNFNANAILFVTQDTTTGFVDNNAYGVAYDSRQWRIFNEDDDVMPVGAQFFVLAFSGPSATDFTVTATSGSISGDSAFIKSPNTTGKPRVQLQVTQNWTPGGGSGGFVNPHNVGVWDAGSEWGVFNEDLAPMPVGASFNVLVGSGTKGGSLALQEATPSNVSGNASYISNTHTNNQPSAMVFVTQNWNPDDRGGTYDNAPLSVGYSGLLRKWDVQNLVGSMGNNTAFNLLIFSS